VSRKSKRQKTEVGRKVEIEEVAEVTDSVGFDFV
jgi:hypothetical protein